jgi:hypothetical protein
MSQNLACLHFKLLLLAVYVVITWTEMFPFNIMDVDGFTPHLREEKLKLPPACPTAHGRPPTGPAEHKSQLSRGEMHRLSLFKHFLNA